MSETASDQLRKAWEEAKHLVESEFKVAVAQGKEESKKLGDQLGLTKEKLAKMEDAFQVYEKAWEEHRAKQVAQEQKAAAMEAAIAELRRPLAGAATGKEMPEELKKFYSERKAFNKFLRIGEEKMQDAEVKALATDSDVAGGFLVPEEMMTTVIELNVLYSPVRQVADVISISKGDTLEIPKEGSTAFAAQWVNERAARTETTAGNFANVRIPTHELEANPWVTQKMIDDSAINIEQYVAKKLGQQFARTEGLAFISGSGVGQPQGLQDTTNGISNVTVTSSDAFTPALLIAFQYALEEPYASNGTWLSKRANFGQIRGLTAATDNFLWQPGLAAGEPPALLGRPYVACNDIPTLSGSSTSSDRVIYFGDFKAGYKIVDRIGVRVLRDPYTNKPNVEFTTYKRVGGQVVLGEAIKAGVAN